MTQKTIEVTVEASAGSEWGVWAAVVSAAVAAAGFAFTIWMSRRRDD